MAPKELNHFNQLRAATITANLGAGLSLGEALTSWTRRRARCCRPASRSTIPARAASSATPGSSLTLVFVLALGFIYLVLAAQFESFIDPLIIMLTVPLSMTGALLAL